MIKFLTISREVPELVNSAIDNRIISTFPMVIRSDKIKITPLQIDLLEIAKKLLTAIYPNFNITPLDNLTDIGNLLVLSVFIASDSKNIYPIYHFTEDLTSLMRIIDSYEIDDFDNEIIAALIENPEMENNRMFHFSAFTKAIVFTRMSPHIIDFLLQADCIDRNSFIDFDLDSPKSVWPFLAGYTCKELFVQVFDIIRSFDGGTLLLERNIINLVIRYDNIVFFEFI